MLYQTYIKLCKHNKIETGFSQRIPDYATQYWFEQLEHTLAIFDKIDNKKSPTTIPQATHAKKLTFLDVGAGSGRLSQLLLSSKIFAYGTALEVVPDDKTWSQIHQDHPNIKLVTGLLQDSMSQLNAQQKIYDFILLSEVFEHIPLQDVPPFLESLKKLLAHNGRIFLTTPNAKVQGPAETSHMWHEREPYGHHKHYTLDELRTLFAQHNFTIDTHAFEGHKIKAKFYNKFYYPMTRWDAKLMTSQKLPAFARKTYKYCSSPIFLALKPVYWTLAHAITRLQNKQNNEQNSQTIMLSIKRGTKEKSPDV